MENSVTMSTLSTQIMARLQNPEVLGETPGSRSEMGNVLNSLEHLGQDSQKCIKA